MGGAAAAAPPTRGCLVENPTTTELILANLATFHCIICIYSHFLNVHRRRFHRGLLRRVAILSRKESGGGGGG